MQVGAAKAVAGRWVIEEGSKSPGFAGAFFHGSAVTLPGDDVLPPTSDLDVMLVIDGREPPHKPGKFIRDGVLIEASVIGAAALATPELVLGNYHLAGSFRRNGIIADPTGHLGTVQAVVQHEFARGRWVTARAAQARDRVLHARRPAETAPLAERVIAWLFPTGVLTHVLLAAGLENPTVRRRYSAARELLARYGLFDLYEPLLDVLGCRDWTPAQTTAHLTALEPAFDAASAALHTPVPFASDLSAAARPIAIDGSRDLIARGEYREAVFWIVATACRCQLVLANDAPHLQQEYLPAFRRLLTDLGISSDPDLGVRLARAQALVPRVWAVAEAIMAAHPEITG